MDIDGQTSMGKLPLIRFIIPSQIEPETPQENIENIVTNKLVSIFSDPKYLNITSTNYLQLLNEIDIFIREIFTTSIYYSDKSYNNATFQSYISGSNQLINFNYIDDFNFNNFMLFYKIITSINIIPLFTIAPNAIHTLNSSNTVDVDMFKHINEKLIHLGRINRYVGDYDITNISNKSQVLVFINYLFNYTPSTKSKTVLEVIKQSTPIKKLFMGYLNLLNSNGIIPINSARFATIDSSTMGTIYNIQDTNENTIITETLKIFIKTLFFNNTYMDINTPFYTQMISIIGQLGQKLSDTEIENLNKLYIYISESLFDYIFIQLFKFTINDHVYIFPNYIETFTKTLLARIYTSMIYINKYVFRQRVGSILHLRLTSIEENNTLSHLHQISNLIKFNSMICNLIDMHKKFSLPNYTLSGIDDSEIKKKYLKYKAKYLELVKTK